MLGYYPLILFDICEAPRPQGVLPGKEIED
jgi:hypothetical protein